MRVHQGTPGTQFQAALTANSTNASTIVIPAATATKPSGTGILDFENDPPLSLIVMPFGAGSATNTFTVRVGGWRLVSTLWVYQILCEFVATLSTYAGIAGQPVDDTQLFADTIASPTTHLGNLGTDCWLRSPANNSPGTMEILGHGAGLFQIDIKVANATSGNALVGTK